eukprot:g15682.t1
MCWLSLVSAVYEGCGVEQAAADIHPAVSEIARSYVLLKLELVSSPAASLARSPTTRTSTCGGTLVSRTAILTAAHCLEPEHGRVAADSRTTTNVVKATVFSGSEVARSGKSELLLGGGGRGPPGDAGSGGGGSGMRVFVNGKRTLQVTEFDFRSASGIKDSSWVKRPNWSFVEATAAQMAERASKTRGLFRCCEKRDSPGTKQDLSKVHALRELLRSRSDLALLDFSLFLSLSPDSLDAGDRDDTTRLDFHAQGFLQAGAAVAPVLGVETTGEKSCDGGDAAAGDEEEKDRRLSGAADEGEGDEGEGDDDEDAETDDDGCERGLITLSAKEVCELRADIGKKRELLSCAWDRPVCSEELGVKLITMGHGLTELTTHDVLAGAGGGSTADPGGRSSPPLRVRELDAFRSLQVGLSKDAFAHGLRFVGGFWKDLGWRIAHGEAEIWRRDLELDRDNAYARHLSSSQIAHDSDRGRMISFPAIASFLKESGKLGVPRRFADAVLQGVALENHSSRLTGAGDSGSGLFLLLPDDKGATCFYLVGVTKSDRITPCEQYKHSSSPCPHVKDAGHEFRPSVTVLEHLRRYHPGTQLDQFTDLRCGVFQDFLRRQLGQVLDRETKAREAAGALRLERAEKKRRREQENAQMLGKTVELRGLNSEKGAELNGGLGLVVRRRDTGEGRFEVEVNGVIVALRPENLKLLASSEEGKRDLRSTSRPPAAANEIMEEDGGGFAADKDGGREDPDVKQLRHRFLGCCRVRARAGGKED